MAGRRKKNCLLFHQNNPNLISVISFVKSSFATVSLEFIKSNLLFFISLLKPSFKQETLRHTRNVFVIWEFPVSQRVIIEVQKSLVCILICLLKCQDNASRCCQGKEVSLPCAGEREPT